MDRGLDQNKAQGEAGKRVVTTMDLVVREESRKSLHGPMEDNGVLENIRVYKARFWIVAIVSTLLIVYSSNIMMWGPISKSVEAVIPGWDSSTVALLMDWGPIMLVLFMLPANWAVQRWGLRVETLAGAALLTVGTVIRCLTTVTPAFTVLCHVGAILVGISTPFLIITPPLVAAVWFPPTERTTAMAVMMGSLQLGGVGSYLEPLLVEVPSDTVTVDEVRQEIMILLYIGAGMCGVLLVAVVVYFPSQPPSPPSLSSTTTRIHLGPGLKALFTNKSFLLLLFSYGVFVGPPMGWVTILNFSLIPLGFQQDTTMWVGIASVLGASISPVISGLINDHYQGNIKVLLVVLMTATTAFFYWFLLLTYQVIPVSTWQVYVSVVGSTSLSYATMPLFYEAAIDLAYPVPEVLVSGVLVATDATVVSLFLLVLSIPNVGYRWMAYTQVLTSSLTILPLFCFTLRNTRAEIDKITP